MRAHVETSGETRRELDDASESRRWLCERDEPEPYGVWVHALVGAVVLLLLVLLATR